MLSTARSELFGGALPVPEHQFAIRRGGAARFKHSFPKKCRVESVEAGRISLAVSRYRTYGIHRNDYIIANKDPNQIYQIQSFKLVDVYAPSTYKIRRPSDHAKVTFCLIPMLVSRFKQNRIRPSTPEVRSSFWEVASSAALISASHLY